MGWLYPARSTRAASAPGAPRAEGFIARELFGMPLARNWRAYLCRETDDYELGRPQRCAGGYVPPKKLVVHHTATTNGYSDVEQARAEVRSIYTYHAVTLGWGEVGYHALIDKFGNVHKGRYGRELDGSREVFSTGVTAGHATSHNYGSVGVSLLGTFTKHGEGGRPGASPTAQAIDVLRGMLVFEAGPRRARPLGKRGRRR